MRVVSTRGAAAPPGVQIRLLGPVEVADGGGRIVPLGGPRLRTLIGALALRAPDVVSRDTLIEGMWDAHPPAGVEKTLRAHVAYLRRSLIAGGMGELVATRSPGYALTAPVASVDVHLFLDLIGSARRAPTAQATADTLRTALGLWRGEVLAGCPSGEWVRAEATRLHEARLNATEDLFAAELALGRHAGVAAELESMVASHPLRERLWVLLMRALYQGGRQGEALQAYRRVRTLLVNEIGVEPGAELKRLEAAILAGRDAPDGPAVLGSDPPAGGSDRTGAGTVPTPLSRLIGRRTEIAELSALLAERRLITLTGVGGSGKTRLAIAVAGRIGAHFTDGVRFVDLAPLADPGLVGVAVADGLGQAADPNESTVAALARYLRRRHCLLVLDNCERVVCSLADLVTRLLRGCPDLRVLATSREALGVLGEVVWPVPPLPVPPSSVARSLGLARASGYDAVRLFLDRAGVSAVRGFTDEDAPGIAVLCARLDGLPLAIELAAARTAVLGVAEITDRLHDPALLCVTRHPDRPHHRAMHATIAWSYDLLDSATQDRFRRLAVFSGGFTLGAAEAVWGGLAAVDLLADLVAKSLVVVERDDGGARYRLLETIGRWASARLAECPDAERDARTRHAVHYLALAEEADQRLDRPEASGALARLAADHENLRSALAWFAGGGQDPVGQLRLAVALARYCRLRGRYGEGRQWLEHAVAGQAAAAPGLASRALEATADFALLTCEYDEAQRLGEQAIGLWERAGDRLGMARTLRLLASVARERGDYPRALALLDRSRMALGKGDAKGSAVLLSQIGFTWWLAGDLDRAEQAMTAALHGCERLGGSVTAACLLVQLGVVAAGRGQLDLADRLARDGLTRCRELDTKEGIAWAWNLIGLIALRRGRCADAIAALRASLEVHHAIGDRWRQASVLDTLAEAVLSGGDPARAAELSGLAAAIRDTLGVPVPAQECLAVERTRWALRQSLPDAERRAALARGATIRLPEVIASLEIPEPDHREVASRTARKP